MRIVVVVDAVRPTHTVVMRHNRTWTRRGRLEGAHKCGLMDGAWDAQAKQAEERNDDGGTDDMVHVQRRNKCGKGAGEARRDAFPTTSV